MTSYTRSMSPLENYFYLLHKPFLGSFLQYNHSFWLAAYNSDQPPINLWLFYKSHLKKGQNSWNSNQTFLKKYLLKEHHLQGLIGIVFSLKKLNNSSSLWLNGLFPIKNTRHSLVLVHFGWLKTDRYYPKWVLVSWRKLFADLLPIEQERKLAKTMSMSFVLFCL